MFDGDNIFIVQSVNHASHLGRYTHENYCGVQEQFYYDIKLSLTLTIIIKMTTYNLKAGYVPLS